MELLLAALLELLIYVAAYVLGNYGMAIAYTVLGVWVGFGSFLLIPNTLTGSSPSPIASLFFIPLIVAALFTLIARECAARWDLRIKLASFWYSLILAGSFSLTRFLCLQG